MRVLITNDDGVQAEGLIALKRALDPSSSMISNSWTVTNTGSNLTGCPRRALR